MDFKRHVTDRLCLFLSYLPILLKQPINDEICQTPLLMYFYIHVYGRVLLKEIGDTPQVFVKMETSAFPTSSL